jgi:alpha-tubulin suppressor-like RCC1 family protein
MKIASIAAGYRHSFALDSEGELWASGVNEYGQLSLDNTSNQNSFQSATITGLALNVNIVSISAGNRHSLSLDSEGELWASGLNDDGQLGLGNTTIQNSFQSVTISNLTSSTKIVSITAGNYHSLILDSEGRVWASGYNRAGQLGLGYSGWSSRANSFQSVTFKGLPLGTKIISISAGGDHSLALDSDGKVWATGYNEYGQLGLGISGLETGQNSFQLATFNGSTSDTQITSISAGGRHSLALDSKGRVWATGYNYYGQLGLDNTSDQNSFQLVKFNNPTSGAKIISISAGGEHSITLDDDGRVWAAGHNKYGQLGLGISGSETGQNSFQSVTISNLTLGTKIVSIAAGGYYSLVLDSKGKIWATGSNEVGQLGLSDNNTTSYLSFTPVTF